MRTLLKDGRSQIVGRTPVLLDPAAGAPCCCGVNCPPVAPLLDCHSYVGSCAVDANARLVVTRFRVAYSGPVSDILAIVSVEMIDPQSTPLRPIMDNQSHFRGNWGGGQARFRITTRLTVIELVLCLMTTEFGSEVSAFAPSVIPIPRIDGGASPHFGTSLAPAMTFPINPCASHQETTRSATNLYPILYPDYFEPNPQVPFHWFTDVAYDVTGIRPPCDGGPPPVQGACCIQNTCTSATAASCAAAGGTYKGDNTTCTGSTCVTHAENGACCLQDGTGRCIQTNLQDCQLRLGRFVGGPCQATTCVPLPPSGACCVNGGLGGCFEEPFDDCQTRCIRAGAGCVWSTGQTCLEFGCTGPGLLGLA